MRLIYGPVLAVLLLSPFCAADPPAPPKFPDWPVTPIAPVIPTPIPNPMPGPVETLSTEELYVVQGNGNEQLLSSPPGVVKITEEAGPIHIRGKFVDGSGKVQTRTYTGKQVFIVERVAKGQFELLKVPKGTVERRIVSDGEPAPPDPGPKPPDPKPPEPVKSFRVIMVHETGKALTAAQNAVIYGKVVEDYLTKNATGGKAGWKRRDPNTPSEPGVMGELWTAAKAALKPTDPPCVVVEKNGKVEIIPVAATPEAMVAVFDEYLKGAK